MHRPISTLLGTLTHSTAVELYQRHHATTARTCSSCGRTAPCPVRASAASVIVAAGDDPDRYPGSPLPSAGREPDAGQLPPDRTGWAVAGRSRALNPEDLLYDRDHRVR